MNKDLAGALFLIGVFVFMVATKTKAPEILRTLTGSRQISTVLILSLLAYIYTKGFHKTAFVGALLSVYLLKTFWTIWPRSYESEHHVNIAQDRARFDPLTSVDLQFANRTLVHNLPVLLVRPLVQDTLDFPPSTKTLFEMSG